jgi:hypothetical protein
MGKERGGKTSNKPTLPRTTLPVARSHRKGNIDLFKESYTDQVCPIAYKRSSNLVFQTDPAMLSTKSIILKPIPAPGRSSFAFYRSESLQRVYSPLFQEYHP